MEGFSRKETFGLIGLADARAIEGGDYDQEFYNALATTLNLFPDEIDDGVRRAILRYVGESRNESIREHGNYLMMGFVHGYLVGQKLSKNIKVT